MDKVKYLLFLFPILYIIHDMEEILTMGKFINEHESILPISISTGQFTIAFILLFVVSTIGCIRACKGKSFLGLTPLDFFILLVPGVLFANGIGHILQSIFFKGYVPGLITTFVILLPYTLYSVIYLMRKHLLSWKKFLLYFIIGFFIQGPVAFLALLIGKLFA